MNGMKKFSLIAFLLLMTLSLGAKKKTKVLPPPPPAEVAPLAFARTACTLDRVDAGTTPQVITFEFENVSSSPVNVTDVQFEGARMEVTWPVNRIIPQGKERITVEWTPNYHWEEIPDQFKVETKLNVLYTDGTKEYTQTLDLSGVIYLKRSEVFNRRMGALRLHRMCSVWHFCVCGNELPFTLQYANLTSEPLEIQIGLSDAQGTITRELVRETLEPQQERKIEPAVPTADMSTVYSTHVAFYVNGQLQAVEPVEIILWDKAEDPVRKAWKLQRGYTYFIKGCPYQYVYDADDEAAWKRMY